MRFTANHPADGGLWQSAKVRIQGGDSDGLLVCECWPVSVDGEGLVDEHRVAEIIAELLNDSILSGK